jgi:FkbM family methyltransferase
MKPQRRRFDLIEIATVVAMAVLITYATTTKMLADRMRSYAVFGQDGLAELEPIERAYGPGKHSENVEEWFIRDFFRDARGGVFVDIGANHYSEKSNTYFLETALGWSGIAVDAQPEFAEGYRLNRPRTKFFAFFVSDVSGAKEQFYVPGNNNLVASSDPQFVRERARGVEARSVGTISLSDLLDGEHIQKVDFLTMDIELSEPKALAGFDISRFQPKLVCIEAHDEVRQKILDYFATHRYVIVGKYLRADSKNLYFKPIDLQAAAVK